MSQGAVQIRPTRARLRVAVLTPYDYRTASCRQRIYKNVVLFPEQVSVHVLSSAVGRRGGVHVGPGTRTGALLRELGRVLRHIWKARRYDLVVVQKGLTLMNWRGLPRLLARLCPRILYDFDDAVYLGTQVSFRRPLLRRLCDPHQALDLMRRARVVVAGNRHLAEVARRHATRVRVVPTAIDTDWYRVKAAGRPERVVVGWSGSSGTNHYMAALAPVIGRLAARLPQLDFHVISNDQRDLDPQAFAPARLGFTPFNLERLVEDLHRFDVGLMPLSDDEWSRSKCGGKILQYMACGIPPVCSPVGINTEVIRDGVNGYLASTADQWEQCLARLVGDPELRRRVGAQARRTVERHYSNRVVAPRFLEAIREAAGD
jgi:glycosyltransferase involved in cell wall biosynthesis